MRAARVILACLAVLLVLVLALVAPARPRAALVVVIAVAALPVALLALGGARALEPGAGGPERSSKAGGGRPPRGRRAVGLFAQVRALRGTDASREVLRRARRFFDGGGRRFGDAGVRLTATGPEGDEATLVAMRTAWVARHGPRAPPTDCEGRGRSRVAGIEELIARAGLREAARDDPSFEYLDVGSSEGCITAALAAELGLPKARAVACDVVAQPPSASFEFVLTDGSGLPFVDGRFGLVSAFMSAHHFARTDRMFEEAFRVARPGGGLLLREHGRADEAARLYYDLVHAFYETVYRVETTPAEFARRYARGDFAQYRTAAQWVAVAEKAGFELVEKSEPRADSFDTIYLLFRKP
jgi:ubiquinone/menaquinone biosynthesis C-methylase UbiE